MTDDADLYPPSDMQSAIAIDKSIAKKKLRAEFSIKFAIEMLSIVGDSAVGISPAIFKHSAIPMAVEYADALIKELEK